MMIPVSVYYRVYYACIQCGLLGVYAVLILAGSCRIFTPVVGVVAGAAAVWMGVTTQFICGAHRRDASMRPSCPKRDAARPSQFTTWDCRRRVEMGDF